MGCESTKSEVSQKKIAVLVGLQFSESDIFFVDYYSSTLSGSSTSGSWRG